ncbi:MAG: hypothetical protein BEN19_01095 [Epulopiscium sp. Nuni2H_MBin003]|nr:MAG: hypothetical protein BEN19_01095 [Epulopiscium sp. Nuni2H_MBin003]
MDNLMGAVIIDLFIGVFFIVLGAIILKYKMITGTHFLNKKFDQEKVSKRRGKSMIQVGVLTIIMGLTHLFIEDLSNSITIIYTVLFIFIVAYDTYKIFKDAKIQDN